MRISAAGNLAIGTSSPVGRVTIATAAGNTQLALVDTTNSKDGRINYDNDNYNDNTNTSFNRSRSN
jgi:hypothetical protein